MATVLFSVQLLVVGAIVLYLLSLIRWRARTRGRPLPPGPRRIPILGNMFNMPQSRQWIAYRDLSRELGDIISFQVLGRSVVVLGSAEAIFEYLDKQSANTSDRVRTPMAELCGVNFGIGFMPYGQWWRRHRRAFWQYFHRDAAEQYRSTQQSITHIFLEKLLENPSQLKRLVRFNFAASILKIMYGIDIKDENDVYIQTLEEALTGATEGMMPGKFLVEFLPFLQYIPPWFPGATSQRLWAKWMAVANKLKNIPFEATKVKLEHGAAPQSIIAKSLNRLVQWGTVSPEDEDIIKNTGFTALEGMVFRHLEDLNPDFIVMGASSWHRYIRSWERFLEYCYTPTCSKRPMLSSMPLSAHIICQIFGDRDSLVYVNAIIKESLRWHTVLPIGLPHATVADDEFRSYFIPAGTMLIVNTWACMHDPEVYEDPEAFRPERFIRDGRLDASVRDPAAFVFGYGRRICSGRHYAEDTLFISVASALHVFDVGPPLGEDGRPVRVEHVQSDSLSSYPEDCRCTVKPRSAAAEALICSWAAEARSRPKEN